MQRLEIIGDEPLASKTVHHILQCLREPVATPAPPLLLRGHALGNAEEARRLLVDIRNVTVRLDFDAQPDVAELERCLELSRAGVFSLEVWFQVGPSNWYDVGWLTDWCDESQVRLHLTTDTAKGGHPLARLPLDEIRFVRLALGEERERFANVSPCAGISLQEYDLFLENCRKIHHEKTQRALGGGPIEAAGDARLRLPPLTHPTLRDEPATVALLRLLGRIVQSPAVGAWIHGLVSAPDFAEQARARFSFRWLALWGEAVFHDPAALGALRSIYGDEGSRAQLLLEDRAETARRSG